MSQTVVKRANYGLISTVAIKKAPEFSIPIKSETTDDGTLEFSIPKKRHSKWLDGVSYQHIRFLPTLSDFQYTNCYWISTEYFTKEESTFAFSIVHPLPPFSSLCIEGSKLHRRRRAALAMKNSQLLFPIVNANASTLTTPLNFTTTTRFGIKSQASKDARTISNAVDTLFKHIFPFIHLGEPPLLTL